MLKKMSAFNGTFFSFRMKEDFVNLVLTFDGTPQKTPKKKQNQKNKKKTKKKKNKKKQKKKQKKMTQQIENH
jgi:prophage tail gpP-like protein